MSNTNLCYTISSGHSLLLSISLSVHYFTLHSGCSKLFSPSQTSKGSPFPHSLTWGPSLIFYRKIEAIHCELSLFSFSHSSSLTQVLSVIFSSFTPAAHAEVALFLTMDNSSTWASNPIPSMARRSLPCHPHSFIYFSSLPLYGLISYCLTKHPPLPSPEKTVTWSFNPR